MPRKNSLPTTFGDSGTILAPSPKSDIFCLPIVNLHAPQMIFSCSTLEVPGRQNVLRTSTLLSDETGSK